MHRNEFHNTFTGGLELKYVKKKKIVSMILK